MKHHLPHLLLFCILSAPWAMSQTTPSSAPTAPTVPPTTVCGPIGCITGNDASTVAGEGLPTERQAGTAVPVMDSQGRTMRDLQLATVQPRPNLPQPKSDFQLFVQDTTGQNLKLFGTDLFQNTPADFLPATSVSPPADYVVGSGDQIKVRSWGGISIDVLATVDRNGQIFIPQIGAVSVTGLTLAQVRQAVEQTIKIQYKVANLSVTLGSLRSIQIFVLGEARKPGVYTVSSLSTLVNALFTSGGPSPSGSLRNVELKRDGVTITHFDVYELLLRGDKTYDVHLLPGDVLTIPVVGPQMAVYGEVKRPAIYELKPNETVTEALDYAGGLTPLAAVDRASLSRIVDHTTRTVQEFPLDGSRKMVQIQNGDVLHIFPLSPQFDKAVTLSGNVGAPGSYPWHPGMRVSDLIPNRRFLLTRNYYNRLNATVPPLPRRPFSVKDRGIDNQTGSMGASPTRGSATTTEPTEDESPQPEDEVNNRQSAPARTYDPNSRDAATRTGVTAVSSARAAAITTESLQAEDEIGHHETEINWAYAAIERLEPVNLRPALISFALGEAIDHPGSREDQLLQPGDVVVVYSSADLNLPVELRSRFVRVDGEVSKPGIYRIEGTETLRQLLQRAGGVAPHGYVFATQLTRQSVRIAQEYKLHQLVQQEMSSALSPLNNTSLSSDGKQGSSEVELRKAYIQVISSIHATGRVTLQLLPTIASADQLPDFPLQDGDTIFIPARPDTVDVLGNVYNQGALRFDPKARVRDYLKAAGGNTREGDKSQEFVLRADGSVISRRRASNFDKLPIYPGDSVIVPARLRPGFNVNQLLGLGQIAGNLALAAVAINSIK